MTHPALILAMLLAAAITAIAAVRLARRPDASAEQVMLCCALAVMLVLGSMVASAKAGYLVVAHF